MILKDTDANRKWQIVIPSGARKRWKIREPEEVRFSFFWTPRNTLEMKPREKPSWKELIGSLNGKAAKRYKPEKDGYGPSVVKEVRREL